MSVSDPSDDHDLHVSQAAKAPAFTTNEDKSLQDQLAKLQAQQNKLKNLQQQVEPCADPKCAPPKQNNSKPPSQQASQKQAKQEAPPQYQNNQLRELQEKMKMMEDQNAALNNQLNITQNSNVSVTQNNDVSKKFVELNSKLRQLTASNEVLKTKGQSQAKLIQQYQIEIDQLHKQLEKLTGKQIDGSRLKTEEEEKLARLLIQLEQDNKQLLERFGDMNMKMNVLTNENLKLRKFIGKETGVEWEKLQQSEQWRGRSEKLELQKIQIDKQAERIKFLEKQVTDLNQIQGAGVTFEQYTMNKDQEIKQKYIDQLNSYTNIIDEKNQQIKQQQEEITNHVDKSKRNQARIAALETACSKAREQTQIMVQKSQLDDQLINDFRKQLFNNKQQNYGQQFKTEIDELKIQKSVLEQKLTQALLTLQQTQQNQLQILYAGAQLELNDYKEKCQILLSERVALFKRIFDLEERRVQVKSDDLQSIIKEMQNYSRIQQGLQMEFNKKSIAISEQFSKILLEFNSTQLPIEDLKNIDDKIQYDQNNYSKKTEQILSAPKSKRVQKGGETINQQPIKSAGGYDQYMESKQDPKPISKQVLNRVESQMKNTEQLNENPEVNDDYIDQEMEKYVANDDVPSDIPGDE